MAELIDGACQRYSCTPSQLYKESADIFRIIQIAERGKEEEENAE